MSASERVVVVLGGAGTVGSGIVKSLLGKGFQVAVISRDGNRLEKLKNFVPESSRDHLHTLIGDVGSEDGAEEAKGALLKSVGKVTDVVSSLGFSWWQGGPPHTQTLKELHWVLETLLLSTFTSWKAFFPLVKDNPDSSYTFITGGAGERLLMPGTGFLTLGAAGALAFCQVVREEYPEVPCKLNEVKINMGVATPERLGLGYVSHLEVGEAVASLVEKRSTSHTVLCVNSATDLKTLILEGKI
uniref:Peroxisomal trans-2-enoyl-CoA reductase n=1 Tax=Sphenodon punctatus TaxID=8508 RepID=A0A8D0GHA5_SPHPU